MFRRSKRVKREKKSRESTRARGMRVGIKARTLRSVLSVASFSFAIILLLAALGQAGRVGDWVYLTLSLVLGFGYFLIPLVGVLMGVILLRQSDEERTIALGQIAGAAIFFIAGLGILNMLVLNGGGLLGGAISSPVISLFDTSATMIVLLSSFLIGLIILFDMELSRIIRALPAPIYGAVSAVKRRFSKGGGAQELESANGSADVQVVAEPNDGQSVDAVDSAEPNERNKNSEQEPADDSVDVNQPRANAEAQEHSKLVLAKFDSLHSYSTPPSSLLEGDRGKPSVGDIKANTNIIKRTLANFGITVEMDEVSIGPSVTRYALKPAEGVKLARIVGLKNDLALALAAHPIRIEAPVPGKSLVGIEIPNTSKATVGMKALIEMEEFKNSTKALLLTLGKSITGKAYFANLSKMPHMLIAGSTGSGKSVTIHALINSLLFRNPPEVLQMILIDPKRVELTLYNGIPHLLTPVVTNAKQALLSLKWAAKEMDRRYDVLEGKKVRDIDSYHQNIVIPAYNKVGKKKSDKTDGADEEASLPERMPYIVIVIDELADLMQAYPRELEAAVVRIAQMSRAVGIHLVLSTQRPSVNIITGLIKANIPARVALQVASQIDSRTILDTSGAESLLGAGDMLFISGEMSKPTRLQSAFISEKEVKKVVDYIRKQYDGTLPGDMLVSQPPDGTPLHMSLDEMENETDESDDDLYEEAREIVITAKKASTSMLQRKLRIGYGRGARLIDMLEERGVVGPSDGPRGREVLISNDDTEENNSDEKPDFIA